MFKLIDKKNNSNFTLKTCFNGPMEITVFGAFIIKISKLFLYSIYILILLFVEEKCLNKRSLE